MTKPTIRVKETRSFYSLRFLNTWYLVDKASVKEHGLKQTLLNDRKRLEEKNLIHTLTTVNQLIELVL